VGLVADTKMRTEPRVDVLNFEYRDPTWFLRFSDSVVRQYSGRYGVPIGWTFVESRGSAAWS
jgi:hypothetical protein